MALVTRRRRYRRAIVVAMAVVTIVATPWTVIRLGSVWFISGPNDEQPSGDTAIVLGARVYADGTPSKHLRERVDLAVELFESGNVSQLLMTGNGSTAGGWSEVEVMRDRALAAGVPESAIILDPAGFDTYLSCFRAAEEYGITDAVVVTQEFHVYRATWLCRRAGIDASGVYPPIGGGKGTIIGNIREVGAAWKAVGNIVFGR